MPANELNPDEALKKALELAQRMTGPRADPSLDDGVRLSELLIVLNRWLVEGGRLPAQWIKPVEPPTSAG